MNDDAKDDDDDGENSAFKHIQSCSKTWNKTL